MKSIEWRRLFVLSANSVHVDGEVREYPGGRFLKFVREGSLMVAYEAVLVEEPA